MMWQIDHKEGWVLKNWCFWTVVLEKTLESPLDYKETTPVNPKGNQSWIFSGRADAEAPTLESPATKSQLIRKDPGAGKDWRQEEKGTTKDEMIAWHHQLNGHRFEQVWGDGERQESLGCCSPWGHEESDMTEQLNNNKKVRWHHVENRSCSDYRDSSIQNICWRPSRYAAKDCKTQLKFLS